MREVRTPDLDFFHKPILDTVLLGVPGHLLDLGHDTRDSFTWPTHDDRVFSEGLADGLHGNASTHRHKHTVLTDKGIQHRAVRSADHIMEFARDTKVHGPKISSGCRRRGNRILHIIQHICCLLRILAAAVYEKNVVSARVLRRQHNIDAPCLIPFEVLGLFANNKAVRQRIHFHDTHTWRRHQTQLVLDGLSNAPRRIGILAHDLDMPSIGTRQEHLDTVFARGVRSKPA